MRQAYAHEAVLVMEPAADVRAPGALITVALCGHWEHEPPCPLAPHHTGAERIGGHVRLRILFAAEPEAEDTVRQRIDTALAEGRLHGPDGVTTRWRLHDSGPIDVPAQDRDHAERLTRT
ncbi:hypothetical protein ACRYCC_37645 [Actinomadura scrupuli]|uniref:hypothetical protein n=1 Tax=Actinomadura scrupuli TaxID=559629 RepID=UPI003D975506